MIDLTPLINAFIAVMAALVLRYLAPWLKERTNAEQRAELAYWVSVAVAAAEQLYHANDGEKKKQYVLNFLSEQGFDVDFDDINNAVEAEVLKLHKELANG